MNILKEEHIEELEKLVKNNITDRTIAKKLSIKFSECFTQFSVKKKRQRLRMFKRHKKIIDKNKFYVNIKKSSGYNPAFFPLKIAKRVGIEDKDIIICKLKNKIFISNIKKIKRKDRINDYFSFYIPFNLLDLHKRERISNNLITSGGEIISEN